MPAPLPDRRDQITRLEAQRAFVAGLVFENLRRLARIDEVLDELVSDEADRQHVSALAGSRVRIAEE